ncbi:MAG TPA: DUF4203 domain-containing protein [bacterium]|nr:DUF4203 domain-containing protein [bacterium]HPN45674.1 DUF4203 domain-containing protein [bacterium]
MLFLSLFAGILLLFLGRRFFWLFVALVGFLAGFSAAGNFFNFNNPLLELLLGVGFGIVGALLALFLQHFAVLIFGFVAGWYCTQSLLLMFGLGNMHNLWLPALIGGIIAMILLSVTFEYALIILSAVIGAYAIVDTDIFPAQYQVIIFAVLVIIGVLFQFKDLTHKPRPVKAKHRKSSH